MNPDNIAGLAPGDPGPIAQHAASHGFAVRVQNLPSANSMRINLLNSAIAARLLNLAFSPSSFFNRFASFAFISLY